ncbi:Amidohydrolase family protein [Sulfobacillus thermosulfidooxidans DSM 9293]|uniref:Amidohydrolase family protein n=1 Tax=Sulfobacillus thermosulfidooxidans (strain DSM 9293 / VKM B-1269 / AT-1) TaxID=929705 RepID=A0A1W1WMP0_SULTA|nr:amidohydrolase family protein [Sulfobacillus thermosulfidooxidans]SMC07462.1 Amidohydrolase family protein [Sulfobacillus thermosulfidooxidans DSM 9293]
MIAIEHIDCLYPGVGKPIRDAYILVKESYEGGTIAEIGCGDITRNKDIHRVINGTGCIAVPGLINTHHHLFQTMTRALATDHALFGWLDTLFPIWKNLTEDHIYYAALIGLGELLLSGCTTTSDHLYFVPQGQDAMRFFSASVEAAKTIGMRFYLTRGAMTLGENNGGRTPDYLKEDEDDVLTSMQDLVNKFHDPRPGAWVKVALGPVSVPAASSRLMKESAILAEQLAVRLHTHAWEVKDEDTWAVNYYQKTQTDLLEEWGWLSARAWFAHGVHVDAITMEKLAQAKSGIAHCPSSNMRLGSGVAPVSQFLKAHIPVGLGVDGSASNDSSHLQAEMRQALFLARAVHGVRDMRIDDVFYMATRGGRDVLNWPAIGELAPGRNADIALFRLDDLEHSGGIHPLQTLILSAPTKADYVVIGGDVRVDQGRIVTVDLLAAVQEHRLLAQQLWRAALHDDCAL